MILDIKKAGDPVLKEVCAPVKHIDKSLRALLDDMAETMRKADGVGIAAPQIGKAIRAVVIDAGDGLHELINPEITFKEGTVKETEGCLSVPNYYGEVQRFARVKVKFLNRWGKQKHLTAEGLLSRCIQHELDHLNGQMFIDIAENLTYREGDKK
ncbi:MAG: peptide deformylase [Selenomonadaceae bacterium]|nr:peptide deformylase [Selenomonadaceae bacterium]MBP3722398.1 peptide deformylase [Selenomonadaceae bacterium]